MTCASAKIDLLSHPVLREWVGEKNPKPKEKEKEKNKQKNPPPSNNQKQKQ